MEIVTVINGSPKGRKSITLKFAEYLQKKNPQIEFRFFHVAQDIRNYSKGKDAWQPLLESIGESLGIVWAFPVYIFQAPASLMRFVELIGEYQLQETFRGRYCCAVSTSIHFYDNLAHDQFRGVLEDLGMRYTDYFAADQRDFFNPAYRQSLETFFADFVSAGREQKPVFRKFEPVRFQKADYVPGPVRTRIPLEGLKVAIVADDAAPDTNIGPMVQRLSGAFEGQVDVVELSRLNIRGGCLGCMKCALDHECTYGEKDDIKRVYETVLDMADVLIYAGPLRQRYFSSAMKRFVERRFMRTHYPFMKGKQVALMVSGPLRQCSTLYDTFEADAQVSEAHFAGAVSDEYATSAQIDTAIDALAARLVSLARKHYLPPDSFLGVAGRKLFRDEVWGRYRYIFQADHRYYKKSGFYDFPQKDWKMRLFNAYFMLRLSIPKFRRQARNTMAGFMVKPFMDELEKMK